MSVRELECCAARVFGRKKSVFTPAPPFLHGWRRERDREEKRCSDVISIKGKKKYAIHLMFDDVVIALFV